MKHLFIIIKKEFLYLLKDKKIIRMMFIIPLVFFPLLVYIIYTVQKKIVHKGQEKVMQIAFVTKGIDSGLLTLFSQDKTMSISFIEAQSDYSKLIQDGEFDAVIQCKWLKKTNTPKVIAYYNTTQNALDNKINAFLNLYEKEKLKSKLIQENLPEDFMVSVVKEVVDIASTREKFSKTIGGIIPYILIILGFSGSIFPAIGMFSEEKEKHTLETLLITPINRHIILFGKLIVIACVGIISSILTLAGLVFSILKIMSDIDIDSNILGSMGGMIEIGSLLAIVSMLFPLMFFFAGILTLITIYTNTTKEAQIIISPFTFVIIIPAVIGMLQGVELNVTTALIPITNIALCFKEIMAGTIDWKLFFLSEFVLVLLAVLSVWVASIKFSKESNIVMD